ncbi:MAG: HDIG domain-containing protein [Candidatus Diapherotrites archaeon]|nr:HDIG domain-containing protein [Candidatus Diapherotrites archaeon]
MKENSKMQKLFEFAEQIKEKQLQKQVEDFIKNPTPIHFQYQPSNVSFEEAPASVAIHHTYCGGLVDHTLAVTKIALSLVGIVEEVYGAKVNKDFVIAGALLHDVLKHVTYDKTNTGEFSSRKYQIGAFHDSLVAAELYSRQFPKEVIDIAGGRGSSIESLIVMAADHADTKIEEGAERSVKDMVRWFKFEEPRYPVLFAENTPFELMKMAQEKQIEKLREKVKKSSLKNREKTV